MHISEGVLSAPVLIGGAAFTVAGLAVSLKKLRPAEVPKVAMFCVVFFLASLLHVPLGPGTVHLVLAGLLGAVLGLNAVVAIFAALLLQGVLLQFGGLSTLGVNTFNMAAPAVLLFLCLGRVLNGSSNGAAMLAAFVIGSLSLLLSAALLALCLWLSGEEFLPAAKLLLVAECPLALLEGLITLVCVKFLRKVKPELLPKFKSAA